MHRFLFRRGKKRDRWSCGKKRINIESYRGGGGDRGIGNSRAIWQKVIVRTFDDFIIPGGRRCPLFRSVLWSPVFDARSVKRETVSREGEQWRGIETRYTTTQRWFLHGRARSIGPYKTVSLSLSLYLVYSFVSMLRLFSKRLRFLGGEHVKGREDVLMERIPREGRRREERSWLFSRPMFRRRL